VRFPSYTNQVSTSLRQGVHYLLDRQSKEGWWLDYHLPPGMSQAWSTAWVGWSLSHLIDNYPVLPALTNASSALRRCCQEGGWGYNTATGVDADSTAWAIRFLSVTNRPCGVAGVRQLESYLDVHGRAHTFLEASAGSWGDAHSDVTPVVGLALLTSSASTRTIERVRAAVLNGRSPNGMWESFWWSTDKYATAWSLEFLAKSGGVPRDIAKNFEGWGSRRRDMDTAFEVSHLLLAVLALGLSESNLALSLVDCLLDMSESNQGWPPSPLLLVPAKTDVNENENRPNADTGLMTTAIAVTALSRWLRLIS